MEKLGHGEEKGQNVKRKMLKMLNVKNLEIFYYFPWRIKKKKKIERMFESSQTT